jgi:hypothetical protein
MVRIAFLLAAAAAVSLPAAASAQSSPAQPTAKPRPEDKVECRFVNTTGSRLSRDRECKTRAQWEHEADDQRNDLEHQEQRATGDPMNGPH